MSIFLFVCLYFFMMRMHSSKTIYTTEIKLCACALMIATVLGNEVHVRKTLKTHLCTFQSIECVRTFKICCQITQKQVAK